MKTASFSFRFSQILRGEVLGAHCAPSLFSQTAKQRFPVRGLLA